MTNQPAKEDASEEIRNRFRWFITHFDPYMLQICCTIYHWGDSLPHHLFEKYCRIVECIDDIPTDIYIASIDPIPEGLSDDIKQSGCNGYSIMIPKTIEEHHKGFPFLSVEPFQPHNPSSPNPPVFFQRLFLWYKNNGILLKIDDGTPISSVASVKKLWEWLGIKSLGIPYSITNENKDILERFFDAQHIENLKKLSQAGEGGRVVKWVKEVFKDAASQVVAHWIKSVIVLIIGGDNMVVLLAVWLKDR